MEPVNSVLSPLSFWSSLALGFIGLHHDSRGNFLAPAMNRLLNYPWPLTSPKGRVHGVRIDVRKDIHEGENYKCSTAATRVGSW